MIGQSSASHVLGEKAGRFVSTIHVYNVIIKRSQVGVRFRHFAHRVAHPLPNLVQTGPSLGVE